MKWNEALIDLNEGFYLAREGWVDSSKLLFKVISTKEHKQNNNIFILHKGVIKVYVVNKVDKDSYDWYRK